MVPRPVSRMRLLWAVSFRQNRLRSPMGWEFLGRNLAVRLLCLGKTWTGIFRMTFSLGPAVYDGLGAQFPAKGLFQLFSQNEHPVQVPAVRYSHLVDLHQGIFQRHQSHIPRILVIVVTGPLDRAVVEKIGRLAP